MNTVSLKIADEAIQVQYTSSVSQNKAQQIMIAYNPDQTIGENLENIRVKLVGIDFEAIIIENPLTYSFSDTVVGINHQRIDIGLALTNMFNVPVLAQPTVKQIGLEEAIAQKRRYNTWHLDYYGQYKSKRNYGQEAMLTIGNGFFGLRGAYVESRADEDNYPGLYVAGVYNQNTTDVNGRDVVNEDLVNFPNAQYLTFGIDHANPFKIRKADIRDIYRSLDLKTGQLTTTKMLGLGTGHQLMVKTTKIADMKHWHRFVIRYEITPINFSGSLQIYSEIDGSVINDNVERYAQFDQHHINVTGMASAANKVLLAGETRHSKISFTIGSKLSSPDYDLTDAVETSNTVKAVRQVASVEVQPGKPVTFDKAVAVFTSRESGSEGLDDKVWAELDATDFVTTQHATADFYAKVWHDTDVKIRGDITSQKLSRVNIFHLFVSAAAIADGTLDASVGARGLHGEAYRGHVFWDELFVMPFYASHYPKLAKELLMYRYNRLDAAREYAKDNGYEGAMYPWQSGQKGDEQSQLVHLNPLTNEWDPDNSRLQRHVSLAVAYNVWFYEHVTQDKHFMDNYGLEMLLSISKFWLSMVQYNESAKRYDIKGVMGPDEFHERYPNAEDQGLTNNAYTNIMVAWLFKLIAHMKDKSSAKAFDAAAKKAGMTEADCAKADKVRRHLTLDINDAGIIGQFAGYFKLPTLDFDNYRKKYGDISRLDRILKAEGKTPDAYQVAKQADTLMAFFLLDKSMIDELIADMGYTLPADYFNQNLQYYLDRTTHGSTLSRIVYAVLTRMAGNRDQSWNLFHEALFSDYYDIQGGTTAEGIHLGVMGSTIGVEMTLYGGLNVLGDTVRIDPNLPSQWQQAAYTINFQGIQMHFKITRHAVMITTDKPAKIEVAGKAVTTQAAKPQTVKY